MAVKFSHDVGAPEVVQPLGALHGCEEGHVGVRYM